jgi:hypothetical protein
MEKIAHLGYHKRNTRNGKEDDMKILISTQKGQGIRKNDFCWVSEGEILHFGFECDCDNTADGGCGCRRSMVGLDCNKATTTMMVTEVDKIRPIFIKLVEYYHKDWKMSEERAEEIALNELLDLAEVANKFGVGAILEKRLDVFKERKL